MLIADDVADTGATLALVKEFCEGKVAEVRCAVLYEKPRSTVQLRVRLAPHRPLDRLPVERRGAGRGDARSKRPFEQQNRALQSGRPRTHRHFRGEHMTRRKLAPAALLVTLAAVVARARRRRRRLGEARAPPFKAAWIYVGPHNDARLVAGPRRRPAVRPEDARRKVQTTYKENIPEGPQVAQVIESLVRDGNKIIFATSFGFQSAMAAAAKKYPDVQVRAGDRHRPSCRTWPSTSAPARTRSTCPAWPPARRRRTGVIGYVVAVRDPRGDPARERVRARRAGDASGREGASSSGRTRGSTRRRRRRRRRASSPPAPTCSGRTSTARRPASTPSRRASRGSATTRTRRSSRRSRG